VKRKPGALWQKKRGGRAYGSFYVTTGGRDVNLQTSDARVARERLPEALSGKRAWPTDSARAAEASDPLPPPLPPSPTLSLVGSPAPAASTAPDVSPDAGRVGEGGHPGPGPAAVPDQVIPPAAGNDQAEADATNAAAAETAGNDIPPGPDPATFDLPPDVLKGLLTTGARAIVLLQLDLQAFIIHKRTGKRPKQVSPESPIVDVAAQA